MMAKGAAAIDELEEQGRAPVASAWRARRRCRRRPTPRDRGNDLEYWLDPARSRWSCGDDGWGSGDDFADDLFPWGIDGWGEGYRLVLGYQAGVNHHGIGHPEFEPLSVGAAVVFPSGSGRGLDVHGGGFDSDPGQAF